MTLKEKLDQALLHYAARAGHRVEQPVRAVLFDMDGVLYDSMPGHARAWQGMLCLKHNSEHTRSRG
ncbi:MAG: hypothetical protein K2K69_08720, partial [Muribaculaceae bacterium]|nr:hypothetical protein [Muribaculaceae bacterium]